MQPDLPEAAPALSAAGRHVRRATRGVVWFERSERGRWKCYTHRREEEAEQEPKRGAGQQSRGETKRQRVARNRRVRVAERAELQAAAGRLPARRNQAEPPGDRGRWAPYTDNRGATRGARPGDHGRGPPAAELPVYKREAALVLDTRAEDLPQNGGRKSRGTPVTGPTGATRPGQKGRRWK